eukprot:488477-Prorocentrum_lima.AAC.1
MESVSPPSWVVTNQPASNPLPFILSVGQMLKSDPRSFRSFLFPWFPVFLRPWMCHLSLPLPFE